MGVISLSCAAVLDWAVGPYEGKQTGEMALLWSLLKNFASGDVVIADRYYASYFLIARLQQLGIDIVMRQHGGRHTDFRRGKRLGQRDHLVECSRPARPQWMDESLYVSMPKELTMREIRVGDWIVVSTFTNDKELTKRDLLDLYRSRWHIELDLRAIKVGMQMDVLRCKSAQMVRKEIAVHLLAYNLVRTVMARAASLGGVLPRRLSFSATLQALNAFAQTLRHCVVDKLKQIHDGLLARIARLLLPDRPNRVEPRAVKRRPKPHRLLNKPRHIAREQLLKQQQKVLEKFLR